MPYNGKSLLEAAPIKDMVGTKERAHGTSYGLSEVGYDLRIKQTIEWVAPDPIEFFRLMQQGDPWEMDRDRRQEHKDNILKAFHGYTKVWDLNAGIIETIGRTALASSIEEFQMPQGLWAEFRNKSTHARCFVDATLGTDGEPGWNGFLTIEIVFHALEPVLIPAGSGILKAVFHETLHPADYADGKYQNQDDRPVPAIKI